MEIILGICISVITLLIVILVKLIKNIDTTRVKRTFDDDGKILTEKTLVLKNGKLFKK